MTHSLGIDIGSAAVKAALLGPGQELVGVWSRPLLGPPVEALRLLMQDVQNEGLSVRIGLTGCGRDLARSDIHELSELIALNLALPLLNRKARTIIEIGGQSTRYVVVEPDTGALEDWGLNLQCAAGSGSFFEQQAGRLGLTVEQFASRAVEAPRGATVAGRCSVFAKSDMIHLQQKGTPGEEIAYGLCLAMARNFLATVIRGRQLAPPVLVAGGAARNAGLVRAFGEVLDLDDGSLCVSPYPGAEGALGAALSASRSSDVEEVAIGDVLEALDVHEPEGWSTTLAPLEVNITPDCAEDSIPDSEKIDGYLGVDVGSVSTNLVLLSPDGTVMMGIYLPTRGKPIEAIGQGLDRITQKLGDRLEVLGVAVTGSGRHLASHLLGADVVRNEITCQLRGAVEIVPEVDTILEIGGQDSKYIQVRDGHIHDFVMNKICAAGTGSFLEEQAEHLGIAIVDEFSELASRSDSPADLGCQCTVFMHSEVVAAQRRQTPTDDICAGLAYSVASNYLDRVVTGRPVGNSVVFQGGVANNPAVVAAFSQILGVPVHVHPHAGVSGAIGAAHLVREAPPEATTFRGLGACRDHDVRSFECRSCSNRCQVNRIVIEGNKVYFGDACEKYSSRVADRSESTQPDMIATWQQLESKGMEAPRNPRGSIGIPRASALVDQLPFWNTFFTSLGFDVVISEPSSQTTLQKGLRNLPAETCLPIKLAFGHVQELAEKKTDQIFLPSILTRPGDDPRHSHSCPYVQAVPYMIRAAMDATFLTPEVDLSGDEDAFIDGMAQALDPLDVDAFDVEDAFHDATSVAHDFRHNLIEEASEVLQGAQRAIVVIGKPYNVLDPYLNMNLFKHLRRLGELALPMWCLPFEQTELEPRSSNLPWHLNRAILRAVNHCATDERLYPVVVTNFGCGPDAFTQMHLDHALSRQPGLVLEFDEHRAEAGLVTRLEAFLDEIDAAPGTGADTRIEVSAQRAPLQGKQNFVIPYFSDHAYVYAGSLEAAGHRARVLPMPDDEIMKLGEAHSSGKECHPFSILTGDLVRLARSPREGGEVFLYPGTVIPCLLHQYGDGHRMLLDRLGIDDLKVLTPGLSEIKDILGIDVGARMWRGFVAVDLLTKMVCETRPYELEKGQTDETHQQNIKDIAVALATDELSAALTMITSRMRLIPVDRSTPRPLVGVSGDVFTRINPVGNQDLFSWLEDHGCEVWPSPFLVDLTDFSLRHNWDKGTFSEAAMLGALMLRKNVESWRVRRVFRGVVQRGDEPGYEEVLRMASPYLGEQQNEVLVLNVAKMVDFAERGADGIIDAVCFNCMLGTVTAAITGRIRANHDQIPITSLVYNSVEGSQRAALEAFLHQTRAYAARRASAAKPPQNLGSILTRLWPSD